MKPPIVHDENESKFDKFGQAMPVEGEGSDVEAAVDSKVFPRSARIAIENANTCSFTGSDAEGLDFRKARFFDGCLRADRALECPRLPGLPANQLSAREPRELRELLFPLQLAATASHAEMPAVAPPESPASGDRGMFGEEHPNDAAEDMGGQVAGINMASSLTSFMTSCRLAKIHPATTGIIRAQGKQLKLEYGCMTDRRAQAILETLKATSSEVREAHFRSNGLTEKGVKGLLGALPQAVQDIDLSGNNLGHHPAWCKGFQRLKHLRALNLSDCQLGDGATKSLCEAIAKCDDLQALHLGGNDIHAAGRDLAAFVGKHANLEVLDLQWNNITGEPARDLARSLCDNYQNSGSLRDINLSWNPLGRKGDEAGKQLAVETCRQLSQFFVQSKDIKHVDLSKCELGADLCQILADGIAENKTILGIHMSGNEAYVDPRCFIVPLSASIISPSSPTLHALPPAAASASVTGGTGAPPAMGPEDGDPCCWLCQRWREVRLAYTPGISGPDGKHIWAWVFTSIRLSSGKVWIFTDAVKMVKVGPNYVAYVMAPPGNLHFVFQVGARVLTSRTALVKDVEAGASCSVRRMSLPTEEERALGDALVPKMQFDLSRTNYVTVSATRADEVVCAVHVPRQPGEFELERKPPPWRFETSLFASYEDALVRRNFCEQCMVEDLRVSRIGNFAKDDKIKELFRAHYADIKVLYASLCTLDQPQDADATPLAFGVGLHEFTHMLAQHNLVGDDLPLEEADAQFVIAATPPPDEKSRGWHPAAQRKGRVLLRHGFCELLMRLAMCCFARDLLDPKGSEQARQRHKAKSASHALELLLTKHIMHPFPPTKNNFRCVQWRADVLHTEPVEKICRKHLRTVIDPLFVAYARGGSSELGYHFLRPEDWCTLLDALKVLPCDGSDWEPMNRWDRSWIWQFSVMAFVDELQAASHLELGFVGFLEALARLAGLLRSRSCEAAATSVDADKWDYGMGSTSPSTIFCADKAVTEPMSFAACLDTFFLSAAVKHAAGAVEPAASSETSSGVSRA